jgi:hypothetical protein
MKHVGHFDNFLKDTVNLNQSRIDLLEKRVDSISTYLRNSDYDPRIRRFTPQGSWAHKTIIKPPGDKDFDADLLVIIDEVEDWSAAQYVNELRSTFRASDTYKEKVSRKTRCIELNYAGDFHLDLVPVIQEIGDNGKRFYACNRRDDIFEETAPEDYTAWLTERNRITGTNQLRKVIRLLKYLRDIKTTFSVKSILLTTLIGMRIEDADELVRDIDFPDVPTSLQTVVNRLDNFLQSRPMMPIIENPVLPGEDFNRHWDQEKYENFRNKIHQYSEWIDDAYDEEDNDESIAKWRRVFRDDFAKGVAISESSRALAPQFDFADRWLALIRGQGPQVLAGFPINQEHVEAPRWPVDNQLHVDIRAELSHSKNGATEREIQSGTIAPREHWIKFTAHCRTFLPIDFTIWWQVANTGGEAAQKGQMRGEFYAGDGPGVRWERTRFRGVHWVEAFLVNRRNRRCVGRSGPFFVVIA